MSSDFCAKNNKTKRMNVITFGVRTFFYYLVSSRRFASYNWKNILKVAKYFWKLKLTRKIGQHELKFRPEMRFPCPSTSHPISYVIFLVSFQRKIMSSMRKTFRSRQEKTADNWSERRQSQLYSVDDVIVHRQDDDISQNFPASSSLHFVPATL